MSTTPLDTHRQANATSPDLEAALTAIAERGVEFVYFQAITITGRVFGKVVPARHFERLATKGVQQHQTASTPRYPISRPSPSCRGTPAMPGCSVGSTSPTTLWNAPEPNSPVTAVDCCVVCMPVSPIERVWNYVPAVSPK